MNKENKTIIKALNIYGRIPEQWELLEEIEKLSNIINKAIEYINSFDYYIPEDDKPDLLKILKGEIK